MKQVRSTVFLILVFSVLSGFGQQQQDQGNLVPSTYCISKTEYKLYTMINDYRARYDLPPIPLSRSLCYVASLHVKDLFLHHPDKGSCNSHSWSEYGHWKPFCYPRDENKKSSVWDKPKELTRYKGKGYEIVYWENGVAVIDSIITFWKSVDYFNSFLMNTGKWTGKKWNAIGVSIYENYAAAWFGEITDTEPLPYVCGTAPPPEQPKHEMVKNEPQKKVMPEGTASKGEIRKTGLGITETPDKSQEIPGKKSQNSAQVNSTETVQNPTGRYYIVVKSLSPRNEMNRALEEMKKRGYSSARLLEKENKLRLSLFDYELKSRADSSLREVKKNFPDAWILKY